MIVRVLVVTSIVLLLTACAQFRMNDAERATLKAAADKAGDDYVNCVTAESDRYQRTGDSAGLIVELSKKACTAARAAFVDADSALLKTRYMMPEEMLTEDLAALDERATQRVLQRVLAGRMASPPAAAAAAVSPPSGESPYLDCMRAEGRRYASVDEPAEVVAEVAQSRCSALLTDSISAAELEKQGRALVMGMVLDRKIGRP